MLEYRKLIRGEAKLESKYANRGDLESACLRTKGGGVNIFEHSANVPCGMPAL